MGNLLCTAFHGFSATPRHEEKANMTLNGTTKIAHPIDIYFVPGGFAAFVSLTDEQVHVSLTVSPNKKPQELGHMVKRLSTLTVKVQCGQLEIGTLIQYVRRDFK